MTYCRMYKCVGVCERLYVYLKIYLTCMLIIMYVYVCVCISSSTIYFWLFFRAVIFARVLLLYFFIEDHFYRRVKVYVETNNIMSIAYWILKDFLTSWTLLKQPPRGVPWKRCSENMQQIYNRTPMLKCGFNKAALQLYWNYTSAWVFPCKFVAYFRCCSQHLFLRTSLGGCFWIWDHVSFVYS